jgi:hypothetical protein
MKSFNTFIATNKDRIDQFYKDVSFSPPSVNSTFVGNSRTNIDAVVPNNSGKYMKSFRYLEHFFQKNAALVLSLVTDEEDVKQANSLITKLQMHKPLEDFREHRIDIGRHAKLRVILETESGVYDKEILGM